MRLILVGALLIGAGFAGAAAWREYRVQTHPLRDVVRGSSLWVTVVAADDPKVLSAKGSRKRQWMTRAELVEFRDGVRGVSAGGDVVVISGEAGWRGLLPGQRVVFRARVDKPWRADLTVAVLRAQGAPVEVGEASWWQRAAGRVRANFAGAAQESLSEEAAGLLPGLVIGDTSRLSEEVRADFREVDLAHLTAVSGANVTILLGAVLLSMRALTVDLRVGVAVAGIALVLFVVLARPSPSVLRAAVMGAVGLLGLCTGYRKQALPALCTAVILLLAWSPALAVDAGFALSVLATAGLVLLAPGWSEWLRRHGWPRPVADAVAVSAAAFVVTAPVIVAMTGHLSLVGIAVNVLVEPVVAPITVLGAAGALLSCVWSPLAEWELHCTAPLLWWLLTVSDRAAALGASAVLPSGVRSGVAAAAVCAVLIALLRPAPHRAEGRAMCRPRAGLSGRARRIGA
ncbi:ComEC/Rec2 family competence protein [Nocardia huaxiensis]|uniref:ComEC/Rec2 family competence protein n=1 Tax=Nocardia huaxiensis TaxID=2755382 RepID=UPI001FD2BAA8|nr:ComEC/Rec2 family competence protein [Nocardia huaxiensis]